DDELLALAVEVGDHGARVGVEHLRAHRHARDVVLPRRTVLILAAAALAGLGDDLSPVPEIEQRGEPLVRAEDDVASLAPIASGGAAERDELLAPERDAAVASFAS